MQEIGQNRAQAQAGLVHGAPTELPSREGLILLAALDFTPTRECARQELAPAGHSRFLLQVNYTLRVGDVNALALKCFLDLFAQFSGYGPLRPGLDLDGDS